MEKNLKNEIYKPCVKIEIQKIDFNTSEMKEKIKYVNHLQEEILKRKDVDINLLKNTYVII